MSSASNSSIVTSNGKGESPGLPHKPLSRKESGPYDQLEASETYSESSVDSLKIGEILEEQKLDLEGEEFNDFFHGRSDTNSESVQRNGSFLSSEWWTDSPERSIQIRFNNSGPGSERPQTVVSLFDEVVGQHGEHTALAVKRNGEWKSWSYRKYYVDCFTAAKALVELGLEPHHGVCILGFNAPEWHISSIATIMAGGISVGLYLTSTPEACCTYALDCKANIIVVENDTQLQKILQVRDKLPDLKAIIQFTKEVAEKDPMVYDWKQLMNLGTTISDSNLRPRIDSLQANKCCSIIYTSGTSGTSKGVMLSHDNLTWMCRRVKQYVNCTTGEEHVISYLPLSHVATQLLDIYTTMLSAGTCWFAQPDALKGSLLNTMKEVHPTIFLGVPRVWEKIAEGMQLVIRNNKGLKAKLFSWARGVGLKGNFAKQTGESAMPFGWNIAKVLFFKRVRKALGLDRCHFPMTGAAPTNEETLAYFMSVNIPLHEIYGMSETTGPTTVTTTDLIRYLSVGRAFDGAEIKIDDPDSEGQGEVLIRGRHVFMGYLGRPESTQEVFTSDGWLRSGDVGYISKDNYIYITGRKKELIITAGGEKIAPVPVEGLIKQTLLIVSNALVVGDQQKYLSCLLTLRVEMDETTGLPTNRLTEVALDECRRIGSSSQTVDDILSRGGDHKVLKMLQKGIDAVNKKAPSKIHKIARWSILEQDFSIAGGELTPTMKLKRPVIMMKYLDSIESFYNS